MVVRTIKSIAMKLLLFRFQSLWMRSSRLLTSGTSWLTCFGFTIGTSRLWQLMLSKPPPFTASVVFEEFRFWEPVVTIVSRVTKHLFFRIINNPVCWCYEPATKPKVILMLMVCIILQVLEHLLRLNPFSFFHNFFRQRSEIFLEQTNILDHVRSTSWVINTV